MSRGPLVLSFIFALLTGCNYLLVPLDYNDELNNYQAYIELDDAMVVLENLEVTQTHFIFGLEIENLGRNAFQINQDQIIGLMSDQPFDSISAHQVTVQENPLTREEINDHFKKKARSANTVGILLFAVGTALVINDALKDGADVTDENWNQKKERKATNRDLATFIGLNAIDVASEVAYQTKISAYEELEYLPEELFSKKWIQPGEIHRGKLFFPKKEKFNYCQIRIPLNDKSLVFDFRKANSQELASLRN